MRNRLPNEFEKFRGFHPMYGESERGGVQGFFMIPHEGETIAVISGRGEGWDHVSASLQYRCPTWDEMCFIKDIFFKWDELVLQFHPPRKDYVNVCSRALHLWRPWKQKVNLPPKWMLC